jgi:Ribonuclease G/E
MLVIFATSMATNMTYEELLKKNPGSLVEKIVTEVVNKDTVEVYFEDEDDEQWAVIKVHMYEEDKEMALRLLPDDRWVLQFGYYDDEDEFIELVQPLTQTEIDLIPKGLQKVMRKVVSSEDGLRVPGNILSK